MSNEPTPTKRKRSASAVIAATIEVMCAEGHVNKPRHVAQDVISELFAAGYRIVEAESNAE